MWCALDGVSAQGKARSSRPSHLIGGARHHLRITSCCPLHVALYYQYVAPTCCSSPCCPLRHQSLTSRNIPQFITSPLPRRWRIWDHYDIKSPSMLLLTFYPELSHKYQFNTHNCQTTLPQSWKRVFSSGFKYGGTNRPSWLEHSDHNHGWEKCIKFCQNGLYRMFFGSTPKRNRKVQG